MTVVARITPTWTPTTVLVVDPTAALGLSLARGLRRYGYTVEVTTSLQHAIVRMRRRDVGFAIVHDTGSLRANNVLRLGRCVVIGGRDSPLSALASRGIQFVGKPLDLNEILLSMKAVNPSKPEPAAKSRSITPAEPEAQLERLDPRSDRIDSSQCNLVAGVFDSPQSPVAAGPREGRRRVYAMPALGYSVQNRQRETLRTIARQ